MITLINGNLGSPTGSIRFQLNTDARVIAAPYGQVPASLVVTFQLDSAGNLIQPAQLYSNAELQPQLSPLLLGTYYLVTVYDQNGARINDAPMWWQFPDASGATVDISTMTAIETEGGNVIFYPVLPGLYKTATVHVSSADLLAMPGTTKNLIPSQGANTAIIIQSVTMQYKFGTVPYTLGNADNYLLPVYTGSVIQSTFIPAAGLLNQTANTVVWESWGQIFSPGLAQTDISGKGVDLTIIGTTPGVTLGDGTLEVTIDYTVVTLT